MYGECAHPTSSKQQNSKNKIKRAIHSINRTQCSSEPFQIFIFLYFFVFRIFQVCSYLIQLIISYLLSHPFNNIMHMHAMHSPIPKQFHSSIFDLNRFYDAHIIANSKCKTHTLSSLVHSFVGFAGTFWYFA